MVQAWPGKCKIVILSHNSAISLQVGCAASSLSFPCFSSWEGTSSYQAWGRISGLSAALSYLGSFSYATFGLMKEGMGEGRKSTKAWVLRHGWGKVFLGI